LNRNAIPQLASRHVGGKKRKGWVKKGVLREKNLKKAKNGGELDGDHPRRGLGGAHDNGNGERKTQNKREKKQKMNFEGKRYIKKTDRAPLKGPNA